MKKISLYILSLVILGGGLFFIFRPNSPSSTFVKKRSSQRGSTVQKTKKPATIPSPQSQIDKSKTLTQKKEGEKSPLPKIVKKALALLRATPWDNDKQERWERRLKTLRLRADEIVPEIAKALRSIPMKESTPRFELTYLLGEIGSQKALPVLEELITEAIPQNLLNEPKSEGVPGGPYLVVKTQSVTSAMMIALQSENMEKVQKLLLDSVESPHRSVRREAVMSLKQLFPKDPSIKEKVLAALPIKDKYFYDLQIRHRPIPLSK